LTIFFQKDINKTSYDNEVAGIFFLRPFLFILGNGAVIPILVSRRFFISAMMPGICAVSGIVADFFVLGIVGAAMN